MDEGVVTLTRDEIVAILEREASNRLSISAQELFRRYRSGELEDPGEISDLVILSRLLPEDDRLFDEA